MSISSIGMKDLLEAGVHFGHKSSSWNPRMKKYIFMKRKGVHIIDLQKTLAMAEEAYTYVKNEVANGKRVLFVGTKKQARQAIEEQASRSGMPWVSHRWIGGLLSNFKTVRNSIIKLNRYEKILAEPAEQEKYTKKELVQLGKIRDKMVKTFGGIREMKKLPDMLFVVDAHHEEIAITEARRIGIPVVALVDTNSNPDNVDVVIPGNDDAIRSINLFIGYMADAVLEGRALLPDSGIDLADIEPAVGTSGTGEGEDREIDMAEMFAHEDADLEKR